MSVAILFNDDMMVNGVHVNVELMRVSPKMDGVQRSDFFILTKFAENAKTDQEMVAIDEIIRDTRERAIRKAIREFDALVNYYAEQDSDTSTQESIISSMRN